MDSIARNFRNKKLKRIVNVYQLAYTNGVAQGLGDYIRGCFCLMQLSILLGLQFDMDIKNHPMSKFIMHDDSCPKYDIQYHTISKHENINYIPVNSKVFKKDSVRFLLDFINKLNSLEPTGCKNFYTFCNSFPISDHVTEAGRYFIRSKLHPNEMMQQKIGETLSNLGLVTKQFAVIHIRSGDKYMLKHNQLNPAVIKKIAGVLSKNIKPRIKTKYLVLSDNNQIKIVLKKIFPELVFQLTNIVHLGESTSQSLSHQAVMETLLDFFIMSNAYQIIGFSPYNWGSGFSQWCGTLFNIPHVQIQVADTLS